MHEPFQRGRHVLLYAFVCGKTYQSPDAGVSCVKEDGESKLKKQHRGEKHVSERAVNCMLTFVLHPCNAYLLCSQVIQDCIPAQCSTEDGVFDSSTGDCMFGGCRQNTE